MSNKLCDKCSEEMDMYYGLWCPRCEKPPVKTYVCINLVKMLRYLEVKRPGIKDRIWRVISDHIGNNTIVDIDFGDEMQDCLTDDLEDDYELMIKEYPEAKGDMSFEISW